MARGGRASLWANAGILAANTLYFTLSALGLGAVLLASHAAFTVIKYVGAGYLIYLGVRTINGAGLALRRRPTRARPPSTGEPSPEASRSRRRIPRHSSSSPRCYHS